MSAGKLRGSQYRWIAATSGAEDFHALQAHIRGETPPFNADTLNDTVELVHSLARECTLVDREVSKYWLTEFFSRQLKEDPHRKYPATMLAWIRGVRSFVSVDPDCAVSLLFARAPIYSMSAEVQQATGHCLGGA